MKRIQDKDVKQSTQIGFHPVIEGNPNDLSTILTTLKECIRFARVAIVTFDLPIWLKVANMIKQTNLPVIARLGGFHQLQSYLGWMGKIIQNSALLKVIQLIYSGSKTTYHIMNGWFFDKVIRAHFLINAYENMKYAFTEKERVDIKTLMEKVTEGKIRARHTDSDWILLLSMSLNPSDYGWTIAVHEYEPVSTLDCMAPEELLKFTSCSCHGDSSNRRCSCKKIEVMCTSACGVCKGITCSYDVIAFEEDVGWNYWNFWHCE